MTATSIFETTRSLLPIPRRAPSASVSRIAAQALGWFSIALAALEVAAPRQLARRLGLHGKKPLLRGYGGREIAAGIAALAGFLAPLIGRRDHRTARNVGIAIAALGGFALLNVGVAALLAKRLHPR